MPADKLYIQDIWGYRGSYYWYHQGTDEPQTVTKILIDKFVNRKKYKNIYFMGSSKGGTTALYYGLAYNATAIFSGACQYKIGTYLTKPEHMAIFHSMMGPHNDEANKNLLDCKLPNLLSLYNNSDMTIHMIYSKNEPTYDEDIVYLLEDLRKSNIRFTDNEYGFNDHNDVGKYLLKYVQDYFKS